MSRTRAAEVSDTHDAHVTENGGHPRVGGVVVEGAQQVEVQMEQLEDAAKNGVGNGDLRLHV